MKRYAVKTKRYAVKAKRKKFKQPWSDWTESNNWNRTTEIARHIEELGYSSVIEIKEPGVTELWEILDATCVAKEMTDAILDLGFRKQDAVINEFISRLEFHLKDIKFTLGQTNDIQYALKKAKEEMLREEENE